MSRPPRRSGHPTSSPIPTCGSRDLLVTVPGQGHEWSLVRLGGRLSATPLALERAGPAMGEDNDDIFGSLLGLTEPK